MIISASRRTDIPAWNGEWMLRRLQEGVVMTRNPMNPRQVRRVDLSPQTVDCIVFWSKNPAPFFAGLDAVDTMGYPYYFQFSLTPYGQEMERYLPPKEKLAGDFCRLAQRLGPRRVVWRYDPIIVSAAYPAQWHLEAFYRMSRALRGYTDTCVISFVDLYEKTRKNTGSLVPGEVPIDVRQQLAKQFAQMAAQAGMRLCACCEEDLRACGVHKSACIDAQRVEEISGRPLAPGLKTGEKGGQRPGCGCAQSVDIGAYHTCQNGCVYCYATSSQQRARRSFAMHDPSSPLLIGQLAGNEKITAYPIQLPKSMPIGDEDAEDVPQQTKLF